MYTKKIITFYFTVLTTEFAYVSGSRDDSGTLSDVSQAEGGVVLGLINYLR